MKSSWPVFVCRQVLWLLATCASLSAAPPVNDDIHEAIELSLDITFTGTTAETTVGPAEPQVMAGGAGVWYTWVAEDAGFWEVQVRESGSYQQMQAAIYIAPAASAADETARAVFRTGADFHLRTARFFTETGRRYFVHVVTPVASAGEFTIRRTEVTTRPDGDDFAEAPEASGAVLTLSLAGAVREAGEPPSGNAHASVWRKWTAPATGWYMAEFFSLCAMPDETGITVFRGTSLANLTSAAVGVAHENPAPSDLALPGGRILFFASPGEAIFLRFSGNSDAFPC